MEWKSYFESLYLPKDDEVYDGEFKDSVDKFVDAKLSESIGDDSHIFDNPIMSCEVREVIDELKCNKAPGYDQISAEHLQYGGHKLASILTCVFNSMCHNEHIVDLLKRGIIIPIPKGTLDQSIRSNNRGITIVSVILKVFQKIVLKRHILNTGEEFDHLQGAAQSKSSSVQVAWILRETIAVNREKNGQVFVALLDTEKAFDTVWINGLFKKLYDSNLKMDCKLWRMLLDFYKTFRCCVKIGGVYSDWFKCLQGVHQGEPWSMYLYMKMIDDLLGNLRNGSFGAKIGVIHTGNPTYADDIAIVTIHKPLLQTLLNECYMYSKMWRFKFSLRKTEILVFGKDNCPNTTLYLGDKEISVKDGSFHMGIPLSDSPTVMTKLIQGRVDKGQKAFFSVQGLGNTRLPVTPVILSKLYWTVCVPKMMYGLEVSQVKDSDMNKLEQAHGRMAKHIQGLPKQTANCVCIVPLGWLSIEAYLDKMKLLFLWRLLLLSMKSIYKQVAIARICEHINSDYSDVSPIGDMVNIFRKYELMDILTLAVLHTIWCFGFY